MTSGLVTFLSGSGMKHKEKKDLIDFTPISQYACTKCITYKRITKTDELEIGDHLCFKFEEIFYHAILTNIAVTRTGVQMHVVAPFRDMPKLFKICGNEVSSEYNNGNADIAQELLPEVDISRIGMHVVQYGRKTYKKEKIAQRALALVQLSDGKRVPLGSLSKQQIRPEAQLKWDTPDITSSHIATWCSTGECFSFDTKEGKKLIEYKDKNHEISMILKFWEEEDHIKQLTESHRNQLLCDSCFLSELIKMINEMENPEKHYKLISTIRTAWTNDRKIPCGLYRVKYKTIDDHVIVKIKRYNSKHKKLALIVKIETFTFTLNGREKCSEECEIKYKFPYPFWKIPEGNDEKF